MESQVTWPQQRGKGFTWSFIFKPSEMVRQFSNNQFKSRQYPFELIIFMAKFIRQELFSFNLQTFFSQAYWRVVSQAPPAFPPLKPTIPQAHRLNLQLESDISIYSQKPQGLNRSGSIQLTYLAGGTLGSFQPFTDIKEFRYVNLNLHSPSTGLLQFDKFSNERDLRTVQINIHDIFWTYFKVGVDKPVTATSKDEKLRVGVEHVFHPISGTSITFSEPFMLPA